MSSAFLHISKRLSPLTLNKMRGPLTLVDIIISSRMVISVPSNMECITVADVDIQVSVIRGSRDSSSQIPTSKYADTRYIGVSR